MLKVNAYNSIVHLNHLQQLNLNKRILFWFNFIKKYCTKINKTLTKKL